MKILMLAQFYPPLMGGIERHVQNLSQALVRRGHQVTVATLWHAPLSEFESVEGVRIYRIRGTMQRLNSLFTTDRQHSPPFPDPEIGAALREIIKKENPEIVHGHDWMVRSFLPLKGWSGARLFRTLHDCELACAQMRYMYMDEHLCPGPSPVRCAVCVSHHYGSIKGGVTLLSNWGLSALERKLVDVFIPVSRAVAAANQLDARRASVQVLPNFVPDDVAQEFDAHLNGEQLPAQGFILQVGDLVPDKGIDVLIEAYSQLKNPPPLVLIGRRTPQSPRTLPDGVILIESLPHALIMEAWRRCIFGTVASTCLDASPTVTLEAMACARPIIASRLGGIVDQVVDGETGFLVEPGQPEALRAAMERLLAQPELRERMGQAAQKRVVEFQAGNVVGKIENLYQQVRDVEA